MLESTGIAFLTLRKLNVSNPMLPLDCVENGKNMILSEPRCRPANTHVSDYAFEPPAVDTEDLTVDITRSGGGKEGDRICELVGLTWST